MERAESEQEEIERDVAFESAAPDAHSSIDSAYHTKYDRYGPQIVGSVTGRAAAPNTIRLVPLTQN